MPLDLRQQVHWAIKIEMPRDCKSCYERLMSGKSILETRQAIQETTRWGIEGARWAHADYFATIF